MLTARQQQIIDFIRDRQRARGVTPSSAEIQAHFGFASPNAVTSHLKALAAKGVLTRVAHQARSLTLAGPFAHSEGTQRELREVPIFGAIPAGMPVDAVEHADGCIAVDVEMFGLSRNAKVFALKVQGESMIGAGILSGDVVILERKEARPGDIVAALIDNETTLKRLVMEEGFSFLKAENPHYPDLIPAQELIIQGVMIALTRVVKP